METRRLFTQRFPGLAASYHGEGPFLPHGTGRVAVGPELFLESQTTASIFSNNFVSHLIPHNKSSSQTS